MLPRYEKKKEKKKEMKWNEMNPSETRENAFRVYLERRNTKYEQCCEDKFVLNKEREREGKVDRDFIDLEFSSKFDPTFDPFSSALKIKLW